jgi:hypothetical protein
MRNSTLIRSITSARLVAPARQGALRRAFALAAIAVMAAVGLPAIATAANYGYGATSVPELTLKLIKMASSSLAMMNTEKL